MPAPILFHGHLWLFDQLQAPLARLVRLLHRPSLPQAGVRERAAEALAGTGLAAKLAAGALGVAVLASGAIGIHDSTNHHHHHRQHDQANASPVRSSATGNATVARHPSPPARRPPTTRHNRVPGGFAYLGTPTATRRRPAPVVSQRGGGPFGP